MTELPIRVSDREIENAISPFVRSWVDEGSDEWSRELRRVASDTRRQRIRRAIVGRLRRFRRTQHAVNLNYSQQWTNFPLEKQLSREGKTVACRWNGRGLHARAVAIKRVHQLYLMRVLEQLKPRRVLEVGCGNGLNLFVLAARFPDINFTGLELTEGGTAAVVAVTRQPELPRAVIDFSPEPLLDRAPFRRIQVVRGSAAQLPFAAGAFDVVLTSLALEQMEEIRGAALAEIRRVARSHTVMVEPFREWNASGSRRNYVVANDYFQGRVADLPAFGLQPILVTDHMPAKLTLTPGLVVCRVA